MHVFWDSKISGRAVFESIFRGSAAFCMHSLAPDQIFQNFQASKDSYVAWKRRSTDYEAPEL